MTTYMESTGRAIFLSIGKDTPIIQIIGLQGVFSPKQFHKIGETESQLIFEYIPEVELSIRKLRYERI